jgi:hypothetical protein
VSLPEIAHRRAILGDAGRDHVGKLGPVLGERDGVGSRRGITEGGAELLVDFTKVETDGTVFDRFGSIVRGV